MNKKAEEKTLTTMPDYSNDGESGGLTPRSLAVAEGTGSKLKVTFGLEVRTRKSDDESTVVIPECFGDEWDMFESALLLEGQGGRKHLNYSLKGTLTLSTGGKVAAYTEATLTRQELVADEPGKARAGYKFVLFLEPQEVAGLCAALFRPVEVSFSHEQPELPRSLPGGEA